MRTVPDGLPWASTAQQYAYVVFDRITGELKRVDGRPIPHPVASDAFTVTNAMRNRVVHMMSGSAVTVTLPQTAGQFEPGDRVDFLQVGAGQVSFVDDGSSTVNVAADLDPALRAQWSMCTAYVADVDVWVLAGDLEVS